MNKPNGKARGRLNALDLSVVMVILLSLAGFGLARAGHAGVNKVIQGVTKVTIDVYLIGLKTKDADLFKVGDQSAISIRNQPVEPPLVISHVDKWRKQVAFPTADLKKAVALADPTQPLAMDFLISLTTDAEVTKSGYVIRGNKIKVGNLVELEGFKYRVQGVVVDIRGQSQG